MKIALTGPSMENEILKTKLRTALVEYINSKTFSLDEMVNLIIQLNNEYGVR